MKIKFGFSLELNEVVGDRNRQRTYKIEYFSFTKECTVVPRVGETVGLSDGLRLPVKEVYYNLTSDDQEVCVNLKKVRTWNEEEYEELYNDAEEVIKELKNE